MPKIAAVEVCIARVPLDRPINFSTRRVTAREYCLVRVRAEDGTAGLGYCYAVNTAGRLLFHAVTDALAPRLIGDDSHRVEGIWQDLYQDTLLLGRTGVVMRALSAIDIALWDLNARSAELPLYRYLGASVLDRVPSYGSGGYYWPGKGDAELAEELRAFVAAGHRAVKIKVGARGRSPAEEAARLRAAREAIGPDIALMLDANNAWPDLPTALQFMRRFEPMDPYWIEEPFLPDDIDNHAALARATPVPVATGEIEAGRWRFKELLDKRAAAILQTDATVCGGVTEWRRITATASSYGVATSPHAWHDVHVHLAASAPSVSYVEFMPDDHVVNFRRLIDTQLVLDKGDLLLPRTPGLGFDFDPEAIARYGARDIGGEGIWRVMR
ncbi:mandelate racemase/muconate lactonizing enzyme family protein [Plastoroseomonas hellenica]|uniref:mandelate racemase/muconate lactonizing enzyme family protein n=1 Tax=Plastoroseomonas hellenica TaxID=2687306 RepID=UPI001BA5C84B|nr:mandelate racemase/muconate lactonizing enzyme family protein [Plastoroseomonas hellenica]MBR0644908.1 mandelate racemase/muconate lactonizing enzyme family protein [Plastoroseomonas hellenica]